MERHLVADESGDCDRIDIHTTTILIEAHGAFHERIDRVITTDSDIFTGVPLGTTLAENDVSGDDLFAAEFLHSAPFALAIATVLDATLSFFMGHDW
jgi:hypothetical protein